MASRIEDTFARLKAEGRTGFVAFLTVGYPDIESTPGLVRALVEGGADIIELGVPFSDPLAEGPTIQKSSFHALQQGVTMETCLEVVRKLRAEGMETPLIFMGYYNPILAYGVERFARAMRQWRAQTGSSRWTCHRKSRANCTRPVSRMSFG